MNVIFAEMKKIFRPTAIIIILALTGLHFGYFYTQSNGYYWFLKIHDNCDEITLATELIEKHGEVITPGTRVGFEKTLQSYKEEFKEQLKSDELLVRAGVTDYELFDAVLFKNVTPEIEEKLTPNWREILPEDVRDAYYDKFKNYWLPISIMKWNLNDYDVQMYYRDVTPLPDYITAPKAIEMYERSKENIKNIYENLLNDDNYTAKQAERYRAYIFDDNMSVIPMALLYSAINDTAVTTVIFSIIIILVIMGTILTSTS